MATSYPSAILCRDKALLVNMEHIKCIITTGYLLLLNADQPGVLQFAEDVKFRLAHSAHVHAPKEPAAVSTKAQKKGSLMRTSKSDSDLETYLLLNNSASSETSSVSQKSYEDSPFELKALEAVLDTVQQTFSRNDSFASTLSFPLKLRYRKALQSSCREQLLVLSCLLLQYQINDSPLLLHCQQCFVLYSRILVEKQLGFISQVLLQVCAKLSALTDELWRAGDPVLKSPTVHTVSFPCASLSCPLLECLSALHFWLPVPLKSYSLCASYSPGWVIYIHGLTTAHQCR